MKNVIFFFIAFFVCSLVVAQTTVLEQTVNDGGYSIEYTFIVVNGKCSTIYVKYTKNGLVTQRYGYHPENLVLVSGASDLIILKNQYNQITFYIVEGIPFDDNDKEVTLYCWTKIQ